MIARPPFLRLVEGTHGKRVSESSGGEDVIQLAGSGRRFFSGWNEMWGRSDCPVAIRPATDRPGGHSGNPDRRKATP